MRKHLLLFILCTQAIAAQDDFKQLKQRINFFENSVIKEFSLSVPADYSKSLDASEQIKYGLILEEKYHDQKQTFFTAENELFKIEQSLEKRVMAGELTQEESDNLLTSVEYARRIILDARKGEVIKRYQEFKEKLSVKPSLVALHKKIKDTKLPGKCEVAKAHVNAHTNSVEFLIRGKDIHGKDAHAKYNVSEKHIEQGYLFTRFDRGQHYGVKNKVIINFTSVLDDQSVQRFTLYENAKGQFYHAEFFHDEIQKPWLDVFGLFNIGSVSENKKIICNDEGRLPASLTHNWKK